MRRGVDGLTADDLRSSREIWWDDEFTRVLLERIPDDARLLVEIGSGLSRAAHELLPRRPELRYLGIDVDPTRLAVARRELAAKDYGRRGEVVCGAGEELPLADRSADVVLICATLQHVEDVSAVLMQARRLLREGGAILVVEPDHLAQRFYFDGPLECITAAVEKLVAKVRLARLPADLSVGPRVAGLLRRANFCEVSLRLHSLQATDSLAARDVASLLGGIIDSFASLASTDCTSATEAARRATEDWLRELGPETRGQYAWFMPVFVTCAKPEARRGGR